MSGCGASRKTRAARAKQRDCGSLAQTTLEAVCRQLAGENSHHIVEATFKAFARALRRATEQDERRAGQIASSKGVLTQH